MERVQREKIQSEMDKKFKGEGEGGITALAEWARLARWDSGDIQAGGVRRGSHSVGSFGISRKSRDAAGRGAPGVRAA